MKSIHRSIWNWAKGTYLLSKYKQKEVVNGLPAYTKYFLEVIDQNFRCGLHGIEDVGLLWVSQSFFFRMSFCSLDWFRLVLEDPHSMNFLITKFFFFCHFNYIKNDLANTDGSKEIVDCLHGWTGWWFQCNQFVRSGIWKPLILPHIFLLPIAMLFQA